MLIRDVGLLATTFKVLVEARAKLIDKERHAHSMEAAADSPPSYEQNLREAIEAARAGL